jgi:predicted nucleic acid-binding protein
MILDASAAIDYLIEERPYGEWVRKQVAREPEFAAPHLIDLEVASGLRKAVARSDLSERRARAALTDFAEFALARYPLTQLLPRIWRLRSSLTPYDAAYVVLSEALDATLLTTDARLARSHGHRAEILAP